MADAGNMVQAMPTTLDEPVSETIMRDLRQVASKLKVVLLPQENQEGVLQKLKDWDLWGPLIVCLTLSLILSIQAPEKQKALLFASVFFIVWTGAAVVTLNAQLLVGTISFFQSVCVLGYCVFPLTISAVACMLFNLIGVSMMIVRAMVVVVGFVWATRASVVFIAKIIVEERKVLAVYPVFFFYTFISWMILLQK